MDRIPYCEVAFHPHSFGDPDGRLFRWNGQLYRGISSERTPFFLELFRNGVIQRLVDQGLLIETEPTPLKLDGYEMVVRHRFVPFASYPEEWCPAMLKDAAITIIELLTELAKDGLTLKDAHPWNVLFDSYKPVYVDLSSIIPITDNSRWSSYDEFCRFCLYPLILMSHGQERIARHLLPEYEGVSVSDVVMLTGGSTIISAFITSAMSRLISAFRERVSSPYRGFLKGGLKPVQSLFRKRPHSPKFYFDFLKKVRREVESITLASFNTESSDYDGNSPPSLLPQDVWTAKQRYVHKILTELRPGSVLDISGNKGWYSRLAVLFGSRVIFFDTDRTHITQLYYDARDNKLPILPLIMDFTDPTPSRGLSSHFSIAATERFQCEMVLALAPVHDVVFKRKFNFDQIVDGLALFSKRWLFVEFVPREEQDVFKRCSGRFTCYTLDGFINALRRRFSSVSIMPSHSEPRLLLLCEK